MWSINLNPSINNCEDIGFRIFNYLGIKSSFRTLTEEISEHPNYPSILSIIDTLQLYKINTTSLRTSINKLQNFQTPIIAQVKESKTSKDTLFSIIYSVSNDNKIKWYNPINKKIEISELMFFESIFTGYITTINNNNKSEIKKQNIVNRAINHLQHSSTNYILLIFPILFFNHAIISCTYNPIDNIVFQLCYSFSTIIGIISSLLLLMLEVDRSNSALDKICHSGKRTSCDAILDSPASNIFGISWSVIGFTYFVSTFTLIILNQLQNKDLFTVLAYINIFSIPYVFFSLLYQGFVAKYWCPLCITVQTSLILQFISSILGGFITVPSQNMIDNIFAFTATFIIFFLFTQLTIFGLKKVNEVKRTKNELNFLKYDQDVFNTLLNKQEKTINYDTKLGIILGEYNNASNKLLVICNPYCKPCQRAHSIIKELLETNSNIQIQIVFMVTPSKEDIRNKPVKTLLALNNIDKGGQKSVEALNVWFHESGMDYYDFSKSYPFDENTLENQTDEIQRMWKWCIDKKIDGTPTFIINGKKVPDIYTSKELRYFLSV